MLLLSASPQTQRDQSKRYDLVGRRSFSLLSFSSKRAPSLVRDYSCYQLLLQKNVRPEDWRLMCGLWVNSVSDPRSCSALQLVRCPSSNGVNGRHSRRQSSSFGLDPSARRDRRVELIVFLSFLLSARRGGLTRPPSTVTCVMSLIYLSHCVTSSTSIRTLLWFIINGHDSTIPL